MSEVKMKLIYDAFYDSTGAERGENRAYTTSYEEFCKSSTPRWIAGIMRAMEAYRSMRFPFFNRSNYPDAGSILYEKYQESFNNVRTIELSNTKTAKYYMDWIALPETQKQIKAMEEYAELRVEQYKQSLEADQAHVNATENFGK